MAKPTASRENRIRRFWNQAAQLNAAWYVSSTVAFDADRDMGEFFASGARIWSDLKRESGYAPEPHHDVVEIGCGLGRITRAIAAEVATVTAFDVSDEMIRRAQTGAPANIEWRLTDGCALTGVPDQSADAVVAYCVFQHLQSLDMLAGYFREMKRVAKPGAPLMFTLSPRDWRYFLLPLMRLRAWMRERAGQNVPKGVYRREWTGIRPSIAVVQRMAPFPVTVRELHGDKWLFCGRA